MTVAHKKKRGQVKVRVGRVLSAKMDKTVIVAVEQISKHPVFRKYIRKQTKLYAHDKDNQCQEGDLVEIVESRPLSKLKRWRVSKIMEKAVQA
jgi:small subunit ribosomal protein S17